MHKSVDNSAPQRCRAARKAHRISSTDLANEIGPGDGSIATTYQGLSNFENRRRDNIRKGAGAAEYVRALSRLTGKSPEQLGLADLLEAAEAVA